MDSQTSESPTNHEKAATMIGCKVEWKFDSIAYINYGVPKAGTGIAHERAYCQLTEDFVVLVEIICLVSHYNGRFVTMPVTKSNLRVNRG